MSKVDLDDTLMCKKRTYHIRKALKWLDLRSLRRLHGSSESWSVKTGYNMISHISLAIKSTTVSILIFAKVLPEIFTS